MTLEDQSIRETNFQFKGQTNFYRGKVRDVYTIGDELVMVASDRISAFDHVLPRPIPFKGQVLNQINLSIYFSKFVFGVNQNQSLGCGHLCSSCK